MTYSYSVRPGVEDDIAAISAVIDDGMLLDIQWNYRFPKRHEYPEYHRRSIHDRVENYFQNAKSGGVGISVVESKDTSSDATKIVGVAIWQNPGTIMKPQKGDPVSWEGRAFNGLQPDYNRPDGNEARIRLTSDRATEARDKNFNSVYGNRQLFIHFVVIHPDQQRRGLGRMLMNDIIKGAAREEVPVALTLVSSPMGKGMYESVGFKVVEVVYKKLEEDKDYIQDFIMVRES